MLIGLAHEDAKADFARARRRAVARRLRPGARGALPALDAPPRGAARDLGVRLIALDSIVGSVDHRRTDFDRCFLPASPRVRHRWERIAAARRRGVALPPIDVVRVAGAHYVLDGHHRVSVARALGDSHVEARVRAVG